jgi:hypothetical protein
MEGSGRGLIYDTIPEFAWRDWENQDTCQGQTGLRAETWTQYLPNTRQGC